MRILIFAVLIQYPYSIFLANKYFNICFTLGLGLAAIVAWQSSLHLLVRLAAVATACLVAERLGAEYGCYGILMIFSAHLFFTDWRKLAVSWSILNAPYIFSGLSALLNNHPYPPVQGLCLLALPFVPLYNEERGGGYRWEFYAFYIGHLAFLYALRRILWGF
jgi:hypothetical protein